MLADYITITHYLAPSLFYSGSMSIQNPSNPLYPYPAVPPGVTTPNMPYMQLPYLTNNTARDFDPITPEIQTHPGILTVTGNTSLTGSTGFIGGIETSAMSIGAVQFPSQTFTPIPNMVPPVMNQAMIKSRNQAILASNAQPT